MLPLVGPLFWLSLLCSAPFSLSFSLSFLFLRYVVLLFRKKKQKGGARGCTYALLFKIYWGETQAFPPRPPFVGATPPHPLSFLINDATHHGAGANAPGAGTTSLVLHHPLYGIWPKAKPSCGATVPKALPCEARGRLKPPPCVKGVALGPRVGPNVGSSGGA